MQLCRIIYYSLAALHFSSDIFCLSSGASKLCYSFWYYTRNVCKCVLYCTVLMPPVVNPIAVKKYTNIKWLPTHGFEVNHYSANVENLVSF
jgi:hypothetical protein